MNGNTSEAVEILLMVNEIFQVCSIKNRKQLELKFFCFFSFYIKIIDNIKIDRNNHV